MSKRNTRQTIQMLGGMKEYVIVRTGEIRSVIEKSNRSESKKEVQKTLKRLRNLINTNVVNSSYCRWCTLTYAENMQDTKRLYKDFEKFNKRLKYYCSKKNFEKYEYIAVAEPQGRGAWHMHLLLIWNSKAPYIPNEDFGFLWGHGFVRIGKLDDVDNVGAYLTAYLGDIELNSDNLKVVKDKGGDIELWRKYSVKEVDGKKYIKGGRLYLYPPKFNMYRCSRGIKKPKVEYMGYYKTKKKVSGLEETFRKSLKLSDSDSSYTSIVDTIYYNIRRVKMQPKKVGEQYKLSDYIYM